MKSWYFPLVRVEQDDDHGCGIAAVATVCGVTYPRALKEFFPRRRRFDDDDNLHVVSDQMIRVVRRLGFSARVIEPRRWRAVHRPLILPLQWVPGLSYSSVHCVVWDPFDRRIIDPGWDDLDDAHYLDLWRRSNFHALAVTGRRYDP